MAKLLSTTELRSMNLQDLNREVKKQRIMVSAQRLAVHMGTDKDSARFNNERRQLARMLTVMHEREVQEKTVSSSPSAK